MKSNYKKLLDNTKSKNKVKKSTTVEYTFFRFVSYNNPYFQTHSKLIRFKFSELLNRSLKNSVHYLKSHSKEFHKHNIKAGIRTNQISVMFLGQEKYYR